MKPKINNKVNSQNYSSDEYIAELLAELSDPFHKQLIQAYRGNESLQSMESELGKILMEILNSED